MASLRITIEATGLGTSALICSPNIRDNSRCSHFSVEALAQRYRDVENYNRMGKEGWPFSL